MRTPAISVAAAAGLLCLSACGGPAGRPEEPAARGGVALPGDPRPRAEGPDIVVYLIDTLRADHLGAYGYARDTSPRIDAFAAEGVLYERLQAQSSWTKPAVASMLTGLLPEHHGVVAPDSRLGAAATTLPGLLRRAGYETFAVETNSTVGFDFDFDVGFHEFVQLAEKGMPEVHQLSDVVNRRFFAWLDGRATTRPFFALLHTTDPHEPYAPREPFRSRFSRVPPEAPLTEPDLSDGRGAERFLEAHPGFPALRIRDAMVDRYDAEVAFNDASFGVLLDGLRRRGLYRDMVLVLLSDHGEEFLEHGGFSHGSTLYQEVLRVPLLLHLPGGAAAGSRVTSPVQHLDLLPTVLALAGLAAPDGFPGRDLRLALATGESEGPRLIVSHLARLGADQSVESVLEGDLKLVHRLRADGGEERELYDLASDPGEQVDLVRERPALAERLAGALQHVILSLPAAADRASLLDPDLERRLRALGYVR